MPPQTKREFCVGSSSFHPHQYQQDAQIRAEVEQLLLKNDLFNASRVLFSLPQDDTYVYHAMASVRLREVQHVIGLGRSNGLHAWYRNEDDNNSVRDPPPQADISSYISIFKPSTVTESALKNFKTNAKKASIRVECATYLSNMRYIHPDFVTKLRVPKSKSDPPSNPYFDFWEWSCHSLEWAGPCVSAERVKASHHVLPIFMHHFGCVTPSHESLHILKMLADGRAVADIGSGNGYWTHLLRCYGLTVYPVDNMQSEWRASWVDDTIISDGLPWLRKHQNGKDMVLLLVYPIVGGGPNGSAEGAFTRTLVEAFQGDIIAVVGTQNSNGYTGFKETTMDKFMNLEHNGWTKIVQIALPSFAGKDEALFVFQRVRTGYNIK